MTKDRKKKGIRLVFWAFCLGVAIGLTVRALQNYAARQLTSFLASEISKSTSCEFKSDPIRVFLPSLSATARNAAIVCEGKRRLFFRKLQAKFGLSQLREHIARLERLDLTDGFADGVGPDSATFKFIDYLAAPVPAERDYPGRWKLKLHRLYVHKSRLIEESPGSQLAGNGARLAMWRDESNNFELRPEIDDLAVTFVSSSQSEKVHLGKVSAEMYITDDFIDFRNALLKLKNSSLGLNARNWVRPQDRLEGSLNFTFDSQSLGLPDWLDFKLTGQGEVNQTMAEPQIRGRFSAPSPFRILPRDPYEFLAFNSLQGAFEGSPDSGIALTELDARNHSARLLLESPLRIRNGQSSGALRFKAQELAYAGVYLTNTDLTITPSFNENIPAMLVRGSIENVQAAGFSLGPSRTEIRADSGKVELDLNRSGNDGQFSLKARIDHFHQTPQAELNLQLRNFNPLVGSEVDRTAGAGLRLSGQSRISGPLNLNDLAGQGQFSINVTGQELAGLEVHLQNGAINARLADPLRPPTEAGNLTGNLRLDLTGSGKSRLELSIQQLPLSRLNPGIDCGVIDLSTTYDFSLADATLGSGRFDLTRLEAGCQPDTITLSQPLSVPVKDGMISVSNLRLKERHSAFLLDGRVSLRDGFDLRAEGSVDLNSLLTLAPALDDLRGDLQISAGVKGPLSGPQIQGRAELHKAQLNMESRNLGATDISGQFVISNNRIFLENIGGLVNSGSFTLSGEVLPFSPEHSNIHAQIRDVALEPSANTSLILSGDLEFKPGSEGAPVLGGTINIQSAEFNQNINLAVLINSLFEEIFRKRTERAVTSGIPAIALDINLLADRGLYVFTNWVGAELKTNLRIKGTSATPELEGQMETLSGWFGFRNRRFDINSGTLHFRPGQNEPVLEMTSETFVRSQYGDNVLVVLEASGPLTSPRITLASDSGLSQKEILSLLTSSGAMPGTARFERAGRGVELGEIPLLRDESLLNINNVFRRITSIDSILLEPAYNTQRGVIEPTIVATKTITDRFSLIGENFFGSNATETSLRGMYRLSPALGLSGIVDTVSTRKHTAFGVDLTYTILAAQRLTVEIEVSGNDSFEKSELLSALRIGENSLIPPGSIPDLKERLTAFYAAQGYFSSAITVQCITADHYCSRITVQIEEGPLSRISGLSLEGSQVPDALLTEIRRALLIEPPATEDFLQSSQDSLIKKLRSEGYISARVTGAYQRQQDDSPGMDLVLKVTAGDPVSFTFTGNTLFGPEDFLETINLFKRRQPFGNNTINILLQNIERKYRESGYLFVSIKHSEQFDQASSRRNYLVEIDEGTKVAVKSVQWSGNRGLSLETLRESVAESAPDVFTEIFSPRHAVAEQLDLNVQILGQIYAEHGYDDAQVTYQLKPDDLNSQVTITYLIEEGPRQAASDVRIEGLPPEIELPLRPEGPWSQPVVTEYVAAVNDSLASAGYPRAELTTRRDADSGVLYLEVQAHEPEKIGAVHIEGNANIDQSVIRKELVLKPGDNWNREKVDQSKRNLLKLGLFQRVEITAETDPANPLLKSMLVKVSERALRSLEMGGGLNSEYGLHLFGEATDKQLFADGRSLVARLDTYYDSAEARVSQGIASLKYIDPHFIQGGYSLVEDLRFQDLEQPTQEFDLDRISLASYLYRSRESGLSTSFGHTILQENLSSVDSDAIISDLDTGVVTLSFLSAALTYDHRDNPLNPRRGYSGTLEGQLNFRGFGSDADYYALGARLAWLYPLKTLSPRLSLANNSRAASAWTFGTTSNVPISQRYYLGGRNTIRGFSENSLGPRGSEGSVIGGDTLLANNFEIRYLLTEAASAHVFLDAGNVFLRERNVALGDLRLSSGIGLQYLSPIGPVGFDLGHPLDRESGEKTWRLHFSIGTIF